MEYNLLEENWIPVLYADGQCERVGIRRALIEAGKIRQIAASNPMDRVAILRFLLAVLYWCKGNPPSSEDAVIENSFPVEWFTKLDKNKECFNLLGEGKRFYQDVTARRSRAATDLLQEIPTGNNFWHFRHSTDEQNGLCLSCCAMGLLRLPLFSVSGLPDLKSGINGTPPIYILPLGNSLLETLYANWVSWEDLGTPAWVQPNTRPEADKSVPLLVGLTVLARQVWLHAPEGPDACIGCGAEKLEIIRTCMYQTAGKLESGLWNDPHVIYLNAETRKALKAKDLTAAGRFRMDRPWPELLSGIAESAKPRPDHRPTRRPPTFCAHHVGIAESAKPSPGHRPTSLFVVGFATDQAKNIDVWERTINAPRTESVQETQSQIQRWSAECRKLEARVGRSKAMGAAILSAIRPAVEHRVSANAASLVANGAAAWQQATSEYAQLMSVIAKSLSPGTTTAAVQRRKRIADALPDMRPKADSTKKAATAKNIRANKGRKQ